MIATARRQDRLEALAAELGWPEGSRIIGTVGRLQPVKDHALLLRAFAKVRVQVPEAALVIVGDGPLRAALEAQAEQAGLSDTVRFMGDRHDVPRLLTGMEVFALTSTSEGYSVALLEACGPVTVIPQKTRVAFQVPNTLTGEGNMSVDITFDNMDDFSPGAVAK